MVFETLRSQSLNFKRNSNEIEESEVTEKEFIFFLRSCVNRFYKVCVK